MLFGAWVAQARGKKFISREGVADASGKNARWLEAVELGEVDLTDHSIELVAGMLTVANVRLPLVGPVVDELLNDPLGPLGRRLAPLAMSTIDESAAHREDQEDPTGVFDAISSTDRLLVATPFAALFAIGWLAARALGWAIGDVADEGAKAAPGVERLVDLVDQVTIPAAFVAALVVALAVRWLDRAMGVVTWLIRAPKRRGDLEAIRTQLATTRLEIPGRIDWDLDEYEGLLAPPHRASARASGLRCLVCERLEPFLVVAYVVSLVAALLADRSHVGSASMAVMWSIVGAAAALVVMNHHASNVMARRCVSSVTRGLGRKLEDPVQLRVR